MSMNEMIPFPTVTGITIREDFGGMVTICGHTKTPQEWVALLEARKPKRGVDVSKMSPERIEAFWAKVDRTGGPDACWPWLGRCNTDGYGHCWIPGKRGDVRAHRLACALVGKIQPPGLEADHLCNFRGCCNPAHIKFVTHYENSARSSAPHVKNRDKTHCNKGHPLSGPNLAIFPYRTGVAKKLIACRACLTCSPMHWMWAVEERKPPPRARGPWRGPFNPNESR